MTPAHYAGLSRIPLAVLACAFALQPTQYGKTIAAGIVVVAAITDLLDGALARRLGTVSDFGAIMDLTTDKVFVIPMLFLAAQGSPLLLSMCALVTMRELLVMGVRVHAAAHGVVIPALRFGKLKSLALYPALLLLLLGVPGAGSVLALGTLLAVLSGIEYVQLAWPLLAPDLARPGVAVGSVALPHEVHMTVGGDRE